MFESLSEAVRGVLREKGTKDAMDIHWQVPREAGRGDASTSIALSLAKKLGGKPMDLAEEIAAVLRKMPEVEEVTVVQPGYVNVSISSSGLVAEYVRSKETHVKLTKERGKQKQPVIVEYSQPNIAKPLGVHHILSTVIGQALANIHRFGGFPTVAINHTGDWGTQFGKLAVAMEKWGNGKSASVLGLDGLLDLYVMFHEESEKKPVLEDEARAAFKKLEEGDPAMRKFWQEVVAVTMGSIQTVYDRLHVSFDEVQGESFYEDKMAAVVEEGKKKNVFHAGEAGSLIAEFPEESQLPPFLILKGDGATLYSTRDLATIRYRVDRWHPAEILYVVDVAQTLHFKQLFATVQQLQWDVPLLEHVVFGRMRFADRSMSTRKGNILKLQEVLDEAVKRAGKVIEEHGDTIQTDDPEALAEMMGIGAVVYGILSQNRKMDIVFDWDKMLSFEGNSAPYLQYTHARARSILRKADVAVPVFPKKLPVLTDSERLLLHTLLLFPSVIAEAREMRMPHKLANHLYALCQDFNAFYNKEPILKAEEPQRSFRLALTEAAASTLKTGAELLTMRVPDRM